MQVVELIEPSREDLLLFSCLAYLVSWNKLTVIFHLGILPHKVFIGKSPELLELLSLLLSPLGVGIELCQLFIDLLYSQGLLAVLTSGDGQTLMRATIHLVKHRLHSLPQLLRLILREGDLDCQVKLE